MDIRCNKCGKYISLSEACVCGSCGRIECRECADKSFYTCDGCSGKLGFLS